MYTKLKTLVAVSAASISFDKAFSYLIPESLAEKAVPGVRVLIPFGKGNRKRVGLILRVEKLEEHEKKLKPIISAADNFPVLNDEMLHMVDWLRENTFCTYFDAVRTILPSGMNINIKENYTLNQNCIDISLTDKENKVLDFLRENIDTNNAAEEVKAQGNGLILESLISKGILQYELTGKQNVGDSSIKMLELTESYKKSPESFKLTVKQKMLADILTDHDEISVKEACYLCGVGTSVEKKLVEKGAAREYDYEVFRTVNIGMNDSRSINAIVLTDEQQKVFERVSQQMHTSNPHCFLLHGVTGSGKTSVFEKLIGECISLGKQAVLLIPEISLTPQTVRRFRELFGETVAVIHSSLSLGQRMDEYKRIKRGLAKIAVGTRSAVFASGQNLSVPEGRSGLQNKR